MGVDWKVEWKALAAMLCVFAAIMAFPTESTALRNALFEGVALTQWYAREHVLLCLVPAFFLAGAIAVFVSSTSVLKYLGAQANKFVSFSVASVSGSVLAVCSCTVLPLFAGIYRMGAGIGPATAFLYSGPAINVLAIILTARVLGVEFGVARAIGAIVFSVVIGLVMHLFFRGDRGSPAVPHVDAPASGAARPLWKTAASFAAMIGILVFANWARPEDNSGVWYAIYSYKWLLTSIMAALLAVILSIWFTLPKVGIALVASATLIAALAAPQTPLLVFATGVVGLSIITSRRADESGDWFRESWGFAKQILPLLLVGVFIAGFFLGHPGREGLVPPLWITSSVGGNSVQANAFAATVGAFMYFATLTEVPILQGLLGNGMGKGPALALLLAGPALSLPNMIVIRSIIGTKKTAVFILLVIAMATISGWVFGNVV